MHNCRIKTSLKNSMVTGPKLIKFPSNVEGSLPCPPSTLQLSNIPVHERKWGMPICQTSGSAMAEGPRDALVSRNSATTKYPYRMALFA